MDETGHPKDPRIRHFGIAGFVAPSKAWREFERRWKSILNNASLKRPFHMVSFAHSQGQFRNWKGKEDERRLLFGKLMQAITETKATPIGCIVSLEAFANLTQKQQSMFRDPYYLCFQRCVRGAAIEAEFEAPQERVNMVFAHQPEYEDLEVLWHLIKSSWDHGNRCGSFAVSTPEKTSQLQAADIFAYELFHEFDNRLRAPGVAMRWGMRQILGMEAFPLPRISLFDRKELLRIIKESEFPDQTGVEELLNEQMRSAMEQILRWRLQRAEV